LPRAGKGAAATHGQKTDPRNRKASAVIKGFIAAL
jgi:hypothetical protein